VPGLREKNEEGNAASWEEKRHWETRTITSANQQKRISAISTYFQARGKGEGKGFSPYKKGEMLQK